MRTLVWFPRGLLIKSFLLLALIAGMITLSPSPHAHSFSRPGLPVEYIEVPSASMERNIKVQVQIAGDNSPGLYLLDGVRAQDDYNGWDLNTKAFDLYYQSGISVIMPVGGPASFYTNWYEPACNAHAVCETYKWETFLSEELPEYLAARYSVLPHRNAVVGVSVQGVAALNLAAYHPDRFVYAATMSSLLQPSKERKLIDLSMKAAGGYNKEDMWGDADDPAWARNDPTINVELLVKNNTRLWIYCGDAHSASILVGPGQNETAQALASGKRFQVAYQSAGGHNATFNFPPEGVHSWDGWAKQLANMKPDLQAYLILKKNLATPTHAPLA